MVVIGCLLLDLVDGQVLEHLGCARLSVAVAGVEPGGVERQGQRVEDEPDERAQGDSDTGHGQGVQAREHRRPAELGEEAGRPARVRGPPPTVVDAVLDLATVLSRQDLGRRFRSSIDRERGQQGDLGEPGGGRGKKPVVETQIVVGVACDALEDQGGDGVVQGGLFHVRLLEGVDGLGVADSSRSFVKNVTKKCEESRCVRNNRVSVKQTSIALKKPFVNSF